MMMKTKNIIYSLLFIAFIFLTSCKGYLDVVPDNDIETIETTFEKREDAYTWFKTCYSMITMDISDINACPAFWGTDEVVADDYIRLTNPNSMPGLMIADGIQMAQSPYGDVWKSTKFYGGIRYCNLFLSHIDGVYNMLQEEKDLWRAEIQALKAQYYFELMRRYGPIILVPENINAAAPIEEMQQPRRPIDEVVNAIIELCDAAIPKLPYYKEQEQNHYAYFSKEGAATLKATTLLYAASKLFNGNTMMADMVNKNGERLFPAYDKEKWKKAAEAADEALKIAAEGGKQLVEGSSEWPTPMLNTIRDIQQSCLNYDYNNKEVLLCVRHQRFSAPVFYHPRFTEEELNYYDQYCVGGFGASMKMVEMYYTEHGLPLSEDKQWVASRYAMSTESDERYKNIVPLGESVLSLHRRREPRFYANITAHNTFWYKKGVNSTNEPMLCECLQGQLMGTASKRYDSSIPQCLTGYYIKKFDNADVALKDYYANSSSESGDILFRLPDLLLASAEAWNEYLDKPDERVYNPLDKVRTRAGIAKVRDAWKTYARNPQKVETQAGMREIIRQEWNIEFAFEGRRFYNLRRWMIAHEELNAPLYGWNIIGDTEERFYNNNKEPVIVWKKRGFTAPRDYFFPIGSEEVMISGCVQNPGW
ncbi:RagB/SusD family nutrient uptake outer membrane protein [Bacteroides ovatus]